MYHYRFWVIGGWISLITVFLLLPTSLWASPSDISLLTTASGVSVYEAHLEDDTHAYILEVDLWAWARIVSSQTRTTSDSRTSPGYMLRPLAHQAESLAEIPIALRSPSDGMSDVPWRVASHRDLMREAFGEPFALLNGQFFGRHYRLAPGYTARLAFGLADEEGVHSLGYGRTESYRKRILIIEGGSVRVLPYMLSSLYRLQWSSLDSLAVVGLHPFADKDTRGATRLSRTYLWVAGTQKDGAWDRLVILTSSALSERQAYKILRQMGARETLMLDGGGSTQLMVGGESLIASSRPIPHALGIYAAK